MESKFNVRNPAVKRIMQEMKETQNDDSSDFIAEALEDNIFEWHFVIRGPPDTEFEGGVYHGRILLPAEYPFKPPSFIMLTPSGRFETNTKICLSISSFHPEQWQPSWSVRTALTALIAFMPSPVTGSIGSLDFPKEERRVLAEKAHREPPVFGSSERQALIEEMHQRMLQRMNNGPGKSSSDSPDQPKAAGDDADSGGVETRAGAEAGPAAPQPQPDTQQTPAQQGGEQAAVTPVAAAAAVGARPTVTADAEDKPLAGSQPRTPGSPTLLPLQQQQQQPMAPRMALPHTADHGLTLLAFALMMAIGAILVKKVLAAMDLQS